MQIKIEDAFEVRKSEGKELIVAKVASVAEKIEVMKNKGKLKGKWIYIDDDLTKEERETQSEIRKQAREERDKGKTVKVGYKKLIINGTLFKWCEKEKKVVLSRSKN